MQPERKTTDVDVSAPFVQSKAVRFPARQARDLSEYKEGGTYNALGQAQVGRHSPHFNPWSMCYWKTVPFVQVAMMQLRTAKISLIEGHKC